MKEKYAIDRTSEDDVEERQPSCFCSYRFVFTIVGFFMFVLLYAQRVGMSVAVVCMVNHTAVRELQAQEAAALGNLAQVTSSPLELTTLGEGSEIEAEPIDKGVSCELQMAVSNQTGGEFTWTKDKQGHILGAFFYGYMVSQIPGGLLAERFGAKWVLFGFLSLASVSTILTPAAARLSFGLLIVLRVCVGIGSGTMFPAMHAMLGQWSPPIERSKMASIVYAGAMMGNVIAMPLSGFLCTHGFDGGWGSIFYVIGGLSLLSLAAWVVFTSNTPATSRFMPRSEKRYIYQSLKGVVSEEKIPLLKMPWLKFFTSGPVWALIIANFCMDWCFYTLLTNIPTFYKEVLKFDMESNGLYSALPFLGLWINVNLSSFIADRLLSAKIISIPTSRKLFTSFGMFAPAIFLVALSFLDCTQTGLAVALLTASVSLLGCNFSGYFINHMDIAPRYAGTLMGITNGIAAMSGFIAPVVAASLTTKQDRASWQIVFFLSGGIFVFGGVCYLILGSGVVQPWAVDTKQPAAEIRMEDARLTKEEKV